MGLKRGLQIWFVLVFALLLAGTIYASLEKNVLQAYVDLGTDRWGLATLFDAYFGFLAFFFWVAYKEVTVGKRILWFVLLMGLGNFAISGYALWQLAKWDPKTGAAGLLLRSAGAKTGARPGPGRDLTRPAAGAAGTLSAKRRGARRGARA